MGKLLKYLAPLTISLAFFLAYSKISLELYRSHQTRGDLTAYAQGMWNTVNGHFMASTYNYSVHNYYDKEYREINGDNSNIFGVHFNPIILLFVPIYYLFPSPETLFFVQSLLTAGGGFIIYLLAKRILKQESLALMIQLSYLVYFATVSATLSQFHAYTLALFFAPLLLLSSNSKNNLFYYGSLALFLMVQENTSLVAFFFGISLLLNKSTRVRGIWTVLLALIYFFSVIEIVIPALSPYHFYLFSGIYGSNLGGNIKEIALNSIMHPILFIQTIISPENLKYLSNLLIAILPFAVLSPILLLVAFSSLAQNILSSSGGLKTQLMHYESGAVAFLFYAMILGLAYFFRRTKSAKSNHRVWIALALIIVSTLVSYKKLTSLRFNPTLLSLDLYTPLDREMDSVINQIPAGASVSTQDYLSAQLSSRVGLYQFPVYLDQVDYILISKGHAVWPLTEEEQLKHIRDLRANQNMNIAKETANFVLFARKGN